MQQGEPLAPPVDALLLAGSCNYVRLVVLMAVLVAVFDEPPKNDVKRRINQRGDACRCPSGSLGGQLTASKL